MKKLSLVVLLVCLVTISGCSNKAKFVETDYTGIKVLRECQYPVNTLNPHFYKTYDDRKKLDLVCGNLFINLYSEDNQRVEFVPSHAEGMPTKSDDGKKYSIKIREGLKFSDGTVIDANTYEQSYKLLLDPKLLSFRSNVFINNIPVVNAKKYFDGKTEWSEVGIKAIDNNTLELTLEKAISDTDFYVAFSNGRETSPVHIEVYNSNFVDNKKTNNSYGSSLESLPSSGPYKFSKWIRGQYMKLEKVNDYVLADYYKPEIVEYRLVADRKTRAQLYEAGKVDTLRVMGDDYNKYAEDPRLSKIKKMSVWSYFINHKSKTKPFLTDINLRKALYYSMPREMIARDLFKVNDPIHHFVAPHTVVDYDKNLTYSDYLNSHNTNIIKNGQDKALAIESFNKAYQTYGKMEIEVIYYEGAEDLKRTAELIESTWEELFGEDKINVITKMVPYNVLSSLVADGKYDLVPNGYVGNVYNPFVVLKFFKSDYAKNYAKFYNKEFDELYTRCVAGDLTNNSNARIEALVELENMILDEMVVIPMFLVNEARIFNDRIKLITNGEYYSGIEFGLLQSEITPLGQ